MRWMSALSNAKTLPLALEETIRKIQEGLGHQKPDLCLLFVSSEFRSEYESIAPAILSGKRILIAAHGNSLRALIKYLDNIGDDEIVSLNVPTGQPLVYELDAKLKPIRSSYLGDAAAIESAMAAVAAQGKAR